MTAVTQEGPLTFADLVERLPGVTTTEQVGSIVAVAEDRKVLQGVTGDWDLPKGLKKGRPPATLYVEIQRDAGCVVGVTVGRTYFAIGAGDPNGRLFSIAGDPPRNLKGKARERAEASYRDGQIVVHDRPDGVTGRTLLKRAAEETTAWLKKVKVKPEEIRGITLSLPLPVSTTESTVLTDSIESGFGGIESIEEEFKALLGEIADYPSLEKVILANDADVAARGEVRYGKAYKMKDVVAIHAAYGVGAGIVTDGKVLRTGAGGGAGEIGHCVPTVRRDQGRKQGLVPLNPKDEVFTCICGCFGHLEAMAGGEGIIKRLAASRETMTTPPPPELADLLDDPARRPSTTIDALLSAIEEPEPWKPGKEAVLDAAHMLGGAVHTLAHLLKPEAVYLSGKLSEAGDSFLKMVKKGFREHGSLGNYRPVIEFGDAVGQFERRHIMVQGAAMTAVRGTKPLITQRDLQELESDK